jgi:hypothetical protein
MPLITEHLFLDGSGSNKDSQTKSQYIARSAEHLVLSILLSRGFNAGIVSVDEGSDIVAVKDRKLYSVQVKTKGIDRGRYVFAIPQRTFALQDPKNSFYVFVLRNDIKHATHFLVLPYRTLKKAARDGLISEVSKRKRSYYQFVIAQSKKGEFFLKSKQSGQKLSGYEDYWDQMN